VILSEAPCHPERSEGPVFPLRVILSEAKDLLLESHEQQQVLRRSAPQDDKVADVILSEAKDLFFPFVSS
jgi:hypothetical protein